jgi:thiol-disulfide isomerase/thioredoxin
VKTIRSAFWTATFAAAAMGLPSLASAGEAGKGVAFEAGTPSFAEVLAKAKVASKPVFLDFSTQGCGWCKRLDADTLSKPHIAELMTAFVNARVDATDGAGKELAAKFHVRGYPTLVVVDASGSEIDRIVGYRAPEGFKPEIERILRGEATLPALRKQVAGSPDDLHAGLALGKKLAAAAPSEAVNVLTKVTGQARGKDRDVEAEAWMSLASAAGATGDVDGAKAAAERVLTDFCDTDAAAQAVAPVIGSMARTDADGALARLEKIRKESKNAKVSAAADGLLVRLHLQAAGAALVRRAESAGNDAQALNELAWTAFESKLVTEEAIVWARKAVELTKRKDPAILDTLANLLFATGEVDDAIEIQTRAVALATMPALKAELAEALAKFHAAAAVRAARSADDGEDDDAEGEDEDGEEDDEGGADDDED